MAFNRSEDDPVGAVVAGFGTLFDDNKLPKTGCCGCGDGNKQKALACAFRVAIAGVPDDTVEVGNAGGCGCKAGCAPDDADVEECGCKNGSAGITPDDADVDDVAPDDALLFTLDVASCGSKECGTPDDVDAEGWRLFTGSAPNGFWTTPLPETVCGCTGLAG